MQVIFTRDMKPVKGRWNRWGKLETTTSRRRGRPPKPGASRRRNNVTIRLRDDTKAALQQAARDQRSLSEEIETRIERSIEAEKGLAESLTLVWGRRTAGAVLLLGHVLREASRIGKAEERGEWLDDVETFKLARDRVGELLNALAPPGANPEASNLGRHISTWVLLAPADEAIAGVKPLLGDELLERLAANGPVLGVPPTSRKGPTN